MSRPPPPVYVAANPVEAEIVKDYLAGAGIRVAVHGSYAWGGTGDLPFGETYPRLYLHDETQREKARDLLRRYEQGTDLRGSWRCEQCGESSPSNFALCWNCSAPRA